MADAVPMPEIAPPVWDNIPSQLAERRQWLLWKYEAKEGAAKPAKMPYYVSGGKRTGNQGGERDRERLTSLSEVRHAFERGHGKWTGIGFGFLPGDGLIGIDIDGAIDPDTGEVSPRCMEIVRSCDSFTEYSPSGKGVHIYVAGMTHINKCNDIGLEVFCGAQFFTVTGRAWPNTRQDVRALEESTLRRLQMNRARAASPEDCRENVLYCLRHDPGAAGAWSRTTREFTELQDKTRKTPPWGGEPASGPRRTT
jgi:putative DNA primase/helicase